MIYLKVFTNRLESLFSKNSQCKLCSNDLCTDYLLLVETEITFRQNYF